MSIYSHGHPRRTARHAKRDDLPPRTPSTPSTPVTPSLVRPYAELPDRTGEFGAENPLPGAPVPPAREPSGMLTGGGAADGAVPMPSLVRRLTGGAVRGLPSVRAVAAGGCAAAVALLLMTVVLHQTGAWPFARPDSTADRSAPDARLPLPPSMVGMGGPPAGNDGGEDDRAGSEEDGKGAGEEEGRPGQGQDDRPGQDPSAPGAGRPAPGGGGSPTEDCGCRASWHVKGQGDEFEATVRVRNVEPRAVRAWRVTWTWPAGQRLVKGRSADFRESGGAVTVRNDRQGAAIPVGGETTFGLRGTGAGAPAPRLVCHVL